MNEVQAVMEKRFFMMKNDSDQLNSLFFHFEWQIKLPFSYNSMAKPLKKPSYVMNQISIMSNF